MPGPVDFQSVGGSENSVQSGVEGGYAPLDSNLLVPVSFIPNLSTSKVTGLDAAIAAKLDAAQKGAASGVASLDGSTKVPVGQLPASYAKDTPGGVAGIESNGRVKNDVVPLVEINAQSGSYTAVLTDISKSVEITSASATNFTVPGNASVAFPLGTIIEVVQMGAGTVTLVGSAGVTLRSRLGLLNLAGQYASAILRKRDTNEWHVSGDVA